MPDYLFICVRVCALTQRLTRTLCFKLRSVELWFSRMAYLFQQMYSSLLHSCIAHVFMLLSTALLLKGGGGELKHWWS